MCTATRTSSYSPVGRNVLCVFSLGLCFVYSCVLICLYVPILGRCKPMQFGLRGLLCRWPFITEWEMHITAQGASPLSKMTYTVSSGTLNCTIPYLSLCACVCVCSGQQWSVLVQDGLGVMCEIVLPRQCMTSPTWSAAAGRWWTFSGLLVSRRCTRPRFWLLLLALMSACQ